MTKRVAKRALRALVLGTPVDTGKARSNWRVSLYSPTRVEIPPYAPGRKLGIGETANASAAISIGNAAIDRLRVGAARGRGIAGNSVYITNNIEYMDELRRGSSRQQGLDWVFIAFAEARAEIAVTTLLGGDV